MAEQPWYHEGLRFECLGCGRCCTGEPGYVYVNQQEVHALAAYCGCSVPEFEGIFLRTVGRRKSLIELPNGDCVFFDRATRRCRVYAIRPRQCRTWPFWQSNLASRAAWEKMCRGCPGAGRGPLFPADQIKALAAVIHI